MSSGPPPAEQAAQRQLDEGARTRSSADQVAEDALERVVGRRHLVAGGCRRARAVGATIRAERAEVGRADGEQAVEQLDPEDGRLRRAAPRPGPGRPRSGS